METPRDMEWGKIEDFRNLSLVGKHIGTESGKVATGRLQQLKEKGKLTTWQI